MGELKSVDPVSLGKVLAVYGLVAGILLGLVNLVLQTVGIDIISISIPGAQAVALSPSVEFVLTVVLLLVSGFVGGWLAAWVYNVLAQQMGGIELVISK